MGEPLIGSVVCGAVALGMMWWNWQMMEAQKRRGRKVALAAAQAGCLRAKLREAEATASAATTATATRVAATTPAKTCDSLPSPCRIKLAPLRGCPANPHDPSPLFVKAIRDRIETEPMSPAVSSPRAAGSGFFKDGCETLDPAGQPWQKKAAVVDQRVPTVVSDLDVALL